MRTTIFTIGARAVWAWFVRYSAPNISSRNWKLVYDLENFQGFKIDLKSNLWGPLEHVVHIFKTW